MPAPGAVQVLRSVQATRQSRRPWPLPGHVRLHSRSCCVQVLGHAAAAPPRSAASDRSTIPTRTTARRCDRLDSLLRSSAARQRNGGRAASVPSNGGDWDRASVRRRGFSGCLRRVGSMARLHFVPPNSKCRGPTDEVCTSTGQLCPGFSLPSAQSASGGLAGTRRSTRDVRVRRPGVRPVARRFARGTDVPGGFTVRSVGSTGCSPGDPSPLAAGDREPAPRCWSCAARRSPASTAKGWLRRCDTRTAIPPPSECEDPVRSGANIRDRPGVGVISP
jgi:hypothetical protein